MLPVGNRRIAVRASRVFAPPEVRAVRGVGGVGEYDIEEGFGALFLYGAPPQERGVLVPAFVHTLV